MSSSTDGLSLQKVVRFYFEHAGTGTGGLESPEQIRETSRKEKKAKKRKYNL
jgi:hypothetical protein